MTVPENGPATRNVDFLPLTGEKNDLLRGLQEIHKITSQDRTASDRKFRVKVLDMGSHYPKCSRHVKLRCRKANARQFS